MPLTPSWSSRNRQNPLAIPPRSPKTVRDPSTFQPKTYVTESCERLTERGNHTYGSPWRALLIKSPIHSRLNLPNWASSFNRKRKVNTCSHHPLIRRTWTGWIEGGCLTVPGDPGHYFHVFPFRESEHDKSIHLHLLVKTKTRKKQ